MEGKYYYWLHNVAGIGKETRKKLLKLATPKEMFEKSSESISNVLSKQQLLSLEESRWKWNLEEEWRKLQERNIRFCYYGSKDYPEKLMTIPDPPFCLYQKGKKDCFNRPSVAVVGARNCSAYGGLAAKELGRVLAEKGIVTVSGMARGIDGICQWAALEAGGESIGVLGSGVEICYPKENRYLYERLQREGCLVSENPPFTQPKAGLFPSRNRIISGLAEVIAVVEAGEKSGTLITVDMALEQGKEVYVVPGRITDRYSRGCNRLIRQGAGVILSPREFVEEICLMWGMGTGRTEEEKKKNFTKEESKILELLDSEPKNIEEIYYGIREVISDITLSKTIEIILKLQMEKVVEANEGYYWLLFQKSASD